MSRHAAADRESATVEVARLPGSGMLAEHPRRRWPSVLTFLVVLGLVVTGTVYGLAHRSSGRDSESATGSTIDAQSTTSG